MSIRILALSALVAVQAVAFASIAAADGGRDGRWGHRHYPWHAPSELIAGVRGASPLTVPFHGFGWYPGPVHYYGPPPGQCCYAAGAVISVRY